MWKKVATVLVLAVGASWGTVAMGADDVASVISSCAKDTGPADCPVTYQSVGAGDCLNPQAEGNRACLIRMAAQAAAANDCNRAYQLVSACPCHSTEEDARAALKSAGPTGVCSYLKSAK
jgi:hypothetical protein